jgi:hypothetical protein
MARSINFSPNPMANYNSVYKRFSLWCKKGVFDCMLQYFTDDPDMECLSLDTTVSQTHPCAAGASKVCGGQANQALGPSKGERIYT